MREKTQHTPSLSFLSHQPTPPPSPTTPTITHTYKQSEKMSNTERSFIMAKPDAVHRKIVGEIVKVPLSPTFSLPLATNEGNTKTKEKGENLTIKWNRGSNKKDSNSWLWNYDTLIRRSWKVK